MYYNITFIYTQAENKGGITIKYTHIIWDWNGTLLDDISASLASVNDMLERRKMSPIDIVRYRECISVPIRGFYEKVFDLDKEDYSAILREYNEGYLYHLKNCGLSEGAEELLGLFEKAGAKQIIVSSSNNEQLTANVKRYGIWKKFDAVLGAADYMATSKIERAVAYLEKENAKKGEVLVIGDLIHDEEMANKIGSDCILLSSGHEQRERLYSSGAKIIDSLSELKSLLNINK